MSHPWNARTLAVNTMSHPWNARTLAVNTMSHPWKLQPSIPQLWQPHIAQRKSKF